MYMYFWLSFLSFSPWSAVFGLHSAFYPGQPAFYSQSAFNTYLVHGLQSTVDSLCFTLTSNRKGVDAIASDLSLSFDQSSTLAIEG